MECLIRRLREDGFELCVWVNALGHGGLLSHADGEEPKDDMGCFCHRHMAALGKRVGKTLSRDNTRSVALFNCFEDEVLSPVVTLDRDFSHIRFVNCTGELRGNTVLLSDIPPFGTAAFEVK